MLTWVLRESTGYILWRLQRSAICNWWAQHSSGSLYLVLHWCLPDVDHAGCPHGRRKESLIRLLLKVLMQESPGKIVGLFCGLIHRTGHAVPWGIHNSTLDIAHPDIADKGLGIAQLSVSSYVATGFKLAINENWHSSHRCLNHRHWRCASLPCLKHQLKSHCKGFAQVALSCLCQKSKSRESHHSSVNYVGFFVNLGSLMTGCSLL